MISYSKFPEGKRTDLAILLAAQREFRKIPVRRWTGTNFGNGVRCCPIGHGTRLQSKNKNDYTFNNCTDWKLKEGIREVCARWGEDLVILTMKYGTKRKTTKFKVLKAIKRTIRRCRDIKVRRRTTSK